MPRPRSRTTTRAARPARCLAQVVNASKGDPNALRVTGAVMVGGIITGKPPVSLTQATPIARLTSEYNVFVLPANSPFKTMDEVVAQLKKDPGSVKWGGGSRGSTEHIAAAMIARAAGFDPSRINCVAFRGGGEAVSATEALETNAWTPAELSGKAFDDFVEREFAELRGTLTRVGLVQG